MSVFLPHLPVWSKKGIREVKLVFPGPRRYGKLSHMSPPHGSTIIIDIRELGSYGPTSSFPPSSLSIDFDIDFYHGKHIPWAARYP
jgi:hypothetical protein